jgi:hypothetical protein
MFVINLFDASHSNKLKANIAGSKSSIKSGTFHRNTITSRLSNGVGFGMGSSTEVVFVYIRHIESSPVAERFTVYVGFVYTLWGSGHSTIIARSQNMIFLNNNRPHTP